MYIFETIRNFYINHIEESGNPYILKKRKISIAKEYRWLGDSHSPIFLS